MRNILKRLFGDNGHDHVLTLTILFLCGFGLVMIGSASVGQSDVYGSSYPAKNMIKQFLIMFVGFVGYYFIVKKFKYSWINSYTTKVLLGAGTALLFVCRMFSPVNGSYAWIPLGVISLQPSEFMKIFAVIYLAFTFGQLEEEYYIDPRTRKKRKKELQSIKNRECLWLPIIICFVIFAIIAALQKDLGSAIIFLFICMTVFFCVDKPFYKPWQNLFGLLIIAGAVLGVLFFALFSNLLAGYQLTRFATWLHPLANPTTDGWQLVNSMISFTSGLLGKGFNASSQKFGYIPEANNDFIGAIIYEELGVVGLLMIIVPYCIIILKLFRYASRMKNSVGKLYLYGVSTYFFAHLMVNLGGISGLIPMTGVPLLLISSGGSSTLCALLSLGVAQAVITRFNRKKLKEQL